MQPVAVVAADILADGGQQSLVILEVSSVDSVRLHGMEERLDEGVVAELAGTFHALDDAQRREPRPACVGGEFHAAIGVEDQPWSRAPADYVFSPGMCWYGSSLNRCGSCVRILLTYS